MDDDRSMIQTVAHAPNAIARRIERSLGDRYYRRYFAHRPEHAALDAGTAISRARAAERIVFLCLGNICRSPFAAQYANDRLDDVRITSAGLSPFQGVESPAAAVETATSYGVDLRDHTSRRATDAELREADLLFVMDYRNFYLLATRHRDATDRAHFLGSVHPERSSPAIPDPHGSDPETFQDTYAAIAAAIDRLATIMQDETTIRTDSR